MTRQSAHERWAGDIAVQEVAQGQGGAQQVAGGGVGVDGHELAGLVGEERRPGQHGRGIRRGGRGWRARPRGEASGAVVSVMLSG